MENAAEMTGEKVRITDQEAMLTMREVAAASDPDAELDLRGFLEAEFGRLNTRLDRIEWRLESGH